MKDFEYLLDICRKNSGKGVRLIDEFLIYYAAERNKTDREMNLRMEPYRHLKKTIDEQWINLLISQYIAHRIFKKEGLIHKYLNHSKIKNMDATEQEFLQEQAATPWRFSFSIIVGNPDTDFYDMVDVLTGEQFLLYSPGISRTLQERQVIMWFNLISYNGECWQSFGPIGAYSGFEPDDIFFFATELNPDIEDEEDLITDLEENPVPYMMLLAGANYPLAFHKDDQIVETVAEYDIENFDTTGLDKDFKTEYSQDLYRLGLKQWDSHPHFASAYYDENMERLLLYAMTERGFRALTSKLNAHGFNVEPDPDVRVNMSMLNTTSMILKKEINLNPYGNPFHEESSPEDKEQVSNLNDFLGMIIPYINEGRTPDIEKMAKEAGLDIETARMLMEKVMQQTKK